VDGRSGDHTATVAEAIRGRIDLAALADPHRRTHEEPGFRSCTQLYAEARPWQPGPIDILLRAVADDEISGVLLGPPNLGWLYHPYDGGADVILSTRAERNELKARHHTWLSDHPTGL
jgi:hypothetical protein